MPKKNRKPKVADLPAKSRSRKRLDVGEAESVRGGKTKSGQIPKYIEIKLKDVIVS